MLSPEFRPPNSLEFRNSEKSGALGMSYLKKITRQKTLDNNINSDIMKRAGVDAILKRIRRNPRNVRFNDLLRVCDYYFGPPRQRGGSHRVYKMPWPGDPRVNAQNDQGMAKVYQVKQVLKAIDKLEAKNEPEE